MYKTTTAILILIMGLYILYLTQCKKCIETTEPHNKSVVYTDTSGWTHPKPTVTVDEKGIIAVINQDTVDSKTPDRVAYHRIFPSRKIDSEANIVVQPWTFDRRNYEINSSNHELDTQAIVKAYLLSHYYKDSFQTKYGKVYVEDTISRNMITARRWSATTVIPQTTKPYREIYGEFGGYNSKTELISGVKIALGYINKKGQHLKAELLYTNGQLHRGLTFGQPLLKW